MTPFLTHILFLDVPFSCLWLKPFLLCLFWGFLQGSDHRVFPFSDSLVPPVGPILPAFLLLCCDCSAELGSFRCTADL